PAPAELKTVTGWIESEFDRLDRQAPIDPGRVTARRLNRAEYNNTIRDLTGVDLRPADDFPQDDSGYGFDNIGDVLSLSPGLLEIALWVDGRPVQTRTLDAAGLASFAADRQDLAGNRVEFRTRFTAGDHWLAVSVLHMYEGLPASYGGPNPSKRPVPPPPDFS